MILPLPRLPAYQPKELDGVLAAGIDGRHVLPPSRLNQVPGSTGVCVCRREEDEHERRK